MVTFRSMEGAQRALKEFKFNLLEKIFYKIFYCIIPDSRKKRLLNGKWLKVLPAVDPELLKWENFGVRGKKKCIGITIFVLYFSALLLGCFYLVSYLEYYIAVKE